VSGTSAGFCADADGTGGGRRGRRYGEGVVGVFGRWTKTDA
jgi:hypothetical protein